MALITSKAIFEKAVCSDFAVGAFNINNMETLQAVVYGAKKENSPVILQVTEQAIRYIGFPLLMKMVEAAGEETGLDLVLHLDHGESCDICKKCIDEGFPSVMIDGSALPFRRNVELTRSVVEYAHGKGAVVEAELGRLAGMEENAGAGHRAASFTDPEEAYELIRLTEADSLAVAVGTSHGAYKYRGEPYLDFQRLSQIHSAIMDTPLVLHGASSVDQEAVSLCNRFGGRITGAQGVPGDLIRKSLAYGICKVNIDTDTKMAMTSQIRKYLAEEPEDCNPRNYLGPAREAVEKMVRSKIRSMLNSSGRLQGSSLADEAQREI